MNEFPDTIVPCPGCGVAMDASDLAPFTNVVCPQCGVTTRVKRSFGPYTLVRRHAVGGMSMVFVAHDATLDREVALKILSEAYSKDERRIAAFEEEARITASFSHPNVVRVFKTGRAFGRFYIAMELVPGGHLEQRIQERGKLPELEVLPLAIEVAQGLKAAHAAGLIHRDVKPGNILLDAAGHAKLVDFGLALVTHGGEATATELWATPYYVPPETVLGQAEDFRSDMYAFGASWYHALSGKPPCAEQSMTTDRLLEAKKSVLPLSSVEPSVSAATCHIIERLMAYQPAGRPASYDELIADLTNSLAEVKSGKAQPAAQEAGRSKRAPSMLWLASAAVLSVAVLGAWMYSRRSHDPPPLSAPAAGTPRHMHSAETEDAEQAAEIMRNYREANAAVIAGDFESAENRFSALFGNAQVQEPTRSWAGLQALLAAMLDDRPQDAYRQVRPMREHLKGLAVGHPLAAGDWNAMLKKMHSPQPLPANHVHTAAGVIANLLAGLRNWDLGLLEQAADCFHAAQSATLSQDETWVATYQKLTGDYLDDYNVLTSPLFTKMPADAATCTAWIDQLNEALAVMKTRGRARINVKSRQQELRELRDLFEAVEEEKKPDKQTIVEPPSAEDIWGRVRELTREWRFADAAQWLKELPDDAPMALRESLGFMTESAAVFLNQISEDLAAAPFSNGLSMPGGGSATRVAVDDAGNILATMDTGDVRTCQWTDFSPDAMIAIHRVLVKRPLTETQRVRRHECAIAFDWLVGNRERARTAATIIAESNNTFKKRWESIFGALQE